MSSAKSALLSKESLLSPTDLLNQIQSDAVDKLLNSKPHQLPGRYGLDDRIHVAETAAGDFAWCPADKDELLTTYRLQMPERNRHQLQELRRQGIDFDRLFIVHELPDRGYKQGIEQAQHIPIELIEPISRTDNVRQVVTEKLFELRRLTQLQVDRLAEAMRWSAPRVTQALGVALASLAIIAAVVAIVYVVMALFAVLLVVGVLVAGLAAGVGVDPIVLGCIDHPDGTSSLYHVTHYHYPVRKQLHQAGGGAHA